MKRIGFTAENQLPVESAAELAYALRSNKVLEMVNSLDITACRGAPRLRMTPDTLMYGKEFVGLSENITFNMLFGCMLVLFGVGLTTKKSNMSSVRK